MSTQAYANRPAGPAAEGAEYDTHPELALAAVLQMLSRFPARRSPALAQSIARHFELIGRDPRISVCVRACAERLVGDWQAYALLGEAAGEQRAGSVLH